MIWSAGLSPDAANASVPSSSGHALAVVDHGPLVELCRAPTPPFGAAPSSGPLPPPSYSLTGPPYYFYHSPPQPPHFIAAQQPFGDRSGGCHPAATQPPSPATSVTEGRYRTVPLGAHCATPPFAYVTADTMGGGAPPPYLLQPTRGAAQDAAAASTTLPMFQPLVPAALPTHATTANGAQGPPPGWVVRLGPTGSNTVALVGAPLDSGGGTPSAINAAPGAHRSALYYAEPPHVGGFYYYALPPYGPAESTSLSYRPAESMSLSYRPAESMSLSYRPAESTSLSYAPPQAPPPQSLAPTPALPYALLQQQQPPHAHDAHSTSVNEPSYPMAAAAAPFGHRPLGSPPPTPSTIDREATPSCSSVSPVSPVVASFAQPHRDSHIAQMASSTEGARQTPVFRPHHPPATVALGERLLASLRAERLDRVVGRRLRALPEGDAAAVLAAVESAPAEWVRQCKQDRGRIVAALVERVGGDRCPCTLMAIHAAYADLATSQRGCVALPRIYAALEQTAHGDRLFALCLDHLNVIARDHFGNFLCKYFLTSGRPEFVSRMAQRLADPASIPHTIFVDKFGSYVVDEVFKRATRHAHVEPLLRRIFFPPWHGGDQGQYPNLAAAAGANDAPPTAVASGTSGPSRRGAGTEMFVENIPFVAGLSGADRHPAHGDVSPLLRLMCYDASGNYAVQGAFDLLSRLASTAAGSSSKASGSSNEAADVPPALYEAYCCAGWRALVNSPYAVNIAKAICRDGPTIDGGPPRE